MMYAIEVFTGQYWMQIYSHSDRSECVKAFDHTCHDKPKSKFRMICVLRFSDSHADDPDKAEKEEEKPDHKPTVKKGK